MDGHVSDFLQNSRTPFLITITDLFFEAVMLVYGGDLIIVRDCHAAQHELSGGSKKTDKGRSDFRKKKPVQIGKNDIKLSLYLGNRTAVNHNAAGDPVHIGPQKIIGGFQERQRQVNGYFMPDHRLCPACPRKGQDSHFFCSGLQQHSSTFHHGCTGGHHIVNK